MYFNVPYSGMDSFVLLRLGAYKYPINRKLAYGNQKSTNSDIRNHVLYTRLHSVLYCTVYYNSTEEIFDARV